MEYSTSILYNDFYNLYNKTLLILESSKSDKQINTEERIDKLVSDFIAHYKGTGELPPFLMSEPTVSCPIGQANKFLMISKKIRKSFVRLEKSEFLKENEVKILQHLEKIQRTRFSQEKNVGESLENFKSSFYLDESASLPLKEKFNYPSLLNLASLIDKQALNLNELNPTEALLLFRLVESEGELDDLIEQMPSSEKEILKDLHLLKSTIPTIKKSTTYQAQLQFETASRKLKSTLSEQDIYFKQLAKQIDPIMHALDKAGFVDDWQALLNAEAKKTLSIILKYRNNFQKLFNTLNQNNLYSLSIAKEDLEKLNTLCLRLRIPPGLEEEYRWLQEAFNKPLTYQDLLILVKKNANKQWEDAKELSSEEQQLLFKSVINITDIQKLQAKIPSTYKELKKELTLLEKAVEVLKEVEFVKNRVAFQEKIQSMKNAIDLEGAKLNEEIYLKKLLKDLPTLHQAISELDKDKAREVSFDSPYLNHLLLIIENSHNSIKDANQIMELYGRESDEISSDNLKKLFDVAAKLFVDETPFDAFDKLALPEFDQIACNSMCVNAKALLEGNTEQNIGQALRLYHQAAEGFLRLNDEQSALQTLQLAASVQFTRNHPLYGGSDQVKSLESKLSVPHLGAHVRGIGGSDIKQQCLHVNLRNIESQPTLCIDFKLNGHSRDSLDPWLELIEKNPDRLQQFLPPHLAKETQVRVVDRYHYRAEEKGNFSNDVNKGWQLPAGTPRMEIEFEGLGKIYIGYQKDFKAFYNEVRVEIPDKGYQALEELSIAHAMLSMIGCPQALGVSQEPDHEKLLLFHLFRSFFPKKAYYLEKQKAAHLLTPLELRQEMMKREPEMENILKEYLDSESPKIQLTETFPEKKSPLLILPGN